MATEKKIFFEETQDLLESYLKNRLQLIKLQAGEKLTRVVTLLFSGLMIALCAFFILFFLSLMAAHYFSGIFHSQPLGFGMVALIYVALLLIVLLLQKKWLNEFVFAKVIRILFDSDDDDDDEKKE